MKKLFQLPAALLVSAALWIPSGVASAQTFEEVDFYDGMEAGIVFATVLQPDGKVVAAGDFTTVLSTTRNNIAQLTTSGTLDTSFNPNVNGPVTQVQVQDDGRLLIAGSFSNVGGYSRDTLARLNSDGTVDTSFAPTFSGGGVSVVALQTDGKILLGGTFTNVNSTSRNRIARLNSDGTLDTGFNPNANGPVKLLSIQPDGKILATGTFGTIGGGTKTYFARLNTDGTLDTSFTNGGTSGDYITSCPIVAADGSMIFATYVGASYVSKLESDGTYDSTLTDMSGTTSEINAIIATEALFYAPLSSSGSGAVYSQSYSSSGNYTTVSSSLYSLAMQTNGRITYGGVGIVGKLAEPSPLPTESLTYVSGTTLRWTQSVEFPDFDHSEFQLSTDSGSTWSSLGLGTKVGTGLIELTGITLPGSGLLRAVGGTRAGYQGMSRSLAISKVVPISPEIEVTGNSQSILDGDTTPSTADHTDFGNMTPSSGTATRTFTISNPSAVSLSVSGVTITGTHAADFSITTSPPGSISGQQSTALGVTFDPSALGLRTATVTITSNDPDEGSFEFDIQGMGFEPEINLEGNGTSIVDGDATPSATDHTDFGTPSVGGIVVRTFTIQNTGISSLTVSAINLGGHSADFTVGGISLPAVVAPSGSTTFTLTYAPLTSGLRSATVYLLNDDLDEGTYDFVIQGTSSPEINIQGSGNSIVDGDNSPSLSDETDFGVAVSSNEQVISSFTIQNLGTGPLSITAINKSGSHSSDYTVSGLSLPASVASGSTSTFDVTFAPSAVGTRSATITIANNDGDESNYDFAIQGRGVQAGELETQYNPSASATVNAAAVQPDGRVILVGNFTTMGGTARDRAARVNQDGTLDTSFIDPNIPAEVNCVALQADGKILIGGSFTTINGVARTRIARLNADGTLDTGYNPGASGIVYGIALQDDGKAIVSGAFTTIAGTSRNRIAKLNDDGTITSFNPNASSTVYGTVTQSDGSVILHGIFGAVGGTARSRIARVDSSGALDTGYNPNASTTVNCAVLQPDGKLLIGGAFLTVGGTTRTRLARLETDGTLDSGFTATANAEVHGLSLQADGKIIVNGQLTQLNGTTRKYAARLNADGSLDTNFINPNPSTSGFVYGTTLEADGKLLLTGAFTNVDGTPRNRTARLENNIATETLTVASSTRIEWLRGGAGPEARFVTFELSTDGGTTWSLLGNGSRITSGWEITGLGLPGTGQVRATAVTASGRKNGSQGRIQTLTDF